MTRFRFRLATLLRLRESVRDQCQGALAEALEAQRLLAHEQAQVAADLASLEGDQRRAAQAGTVDVDRLLNTQRFEAVLRISQLGLSRQAETLEGEISRRREALLLANREARVLENLREQQRQTHQAESERREMAALDEAAALRPVAEENQPWAS